jgi:competence protein ComEC
VWVDFLDVGQGDAIVIRGGDHAVLIDAGDRGATTVAQLRELGVRRLDLVFATHPHADHIGEMAHVLSSFDVGRYVDNGMTHTTATFAEVMRVLDDRGIPHDVAREGMTFGLGDEATFTVLFPDGALLHDTRSDLNSNSVVLRLDHGGDTFLFTGDAEEPTETALLEAGLGPVDVLKVAHHGSDHSSTAAFLSATRPEQVVISVGAENRYGHPGDETMRRLASLGAIVYRTDQSGHLRAISDGAEIEILEGPLATPGAGLAVTERPPVARLVPLPAFLPVAAPPRAPETVRERRRRERRERRHAR